MAFMYNNMLTDSGGREKKDAYVSYTPEVERPVTTTTTTTRSRGGGSSGPTIPNVTQADIDNTAYAAAQAAAEAARQGMPTYTGSFDDQINQLYAQINGRGEFNYNLNDDAFWQQYKDKYTQAAKSSMRDTMGQAAALTGGYGSSYGQAVGQQAYDRQMENLMDVAPELYQMAYQKYNDEGQKLYDQFNMARQMANDEYSKYQDEYNRWLAEREYADERAETEYQRQQDSLSFLMGMAQLGYTPTAQELAAAGLTASQYQAMVNQYAPKKSRGSSTTTTTTTTTKANNTKVDPSKPYYGLDKNTFIQYRKEWLDGLKK